MKTILGLDLGTNSIGWATIKTDQNSKGQEKFDSISKCGSRILPVDQATLSDFNRGNSISQTAERTKYRSTRRLYERANLRRERLNRVLDILNWLPEQYASCLDRYGKFLPGKEPKLAWSKDDIGKPHFLFEKSFSEMIMDFCNHNHNYPDDKRIPYDWTIYYLRKKALSQAVSKQELAWILLNFNQKRGYNHTREDDQKDIPENKKIEYQALKVVDIINTKEKKGNGTWYHIQLDNGMVYKRVFTEAPDWLNQTKDFIVTTELCQDGSLKKDKDGNIKYSLRLPSPEDWTLKKKKTERDIEKAGMTVGSYIYDSLLKNPKIKIKGGLVHTVERSFYRDELIRILNVQKQFNNDLNDNGLFQTCIQALYPSNADYRSSIASKDFTYLFVDDIIFYQRPLKSKRSLVDDCPYESRHFYDAKTEQMKTVPVKCVSKSHPAYQEFRLWQFLANLRFFVRETNEEITDDLLPDGEHVASLFDWLNDRESIDQKSLLSCPVFGLKKDRKEQLRWNYVEDRSYPCNETRAAMLKVLDKANIPSSFLTRELEERLWHVFFSVHSKQEIRKALERFARKYLQLQPAQIETFAETMSKMPPYDNAYGAYSLKAINKILPLLRTGHHWREVDITSRQDFASRIEKIISGEYDPAIRERVRLQSHRFHLDTINDFQGLPVWLACYIVYNRHSEAKDIERWKSPGDIDNYLCSFKQHSLHNPIVEGVVTETLRTVRDIWAAEGRIDEIHIEMGREMKNPADKRKSDLERQLQNENTNLRIRAMLTEFMNPEFNVENVRPNSPGQQEILRIYEETVLNDGSLGEIPDDIVSTLAKFKNLEASKRPTRTEVMRYKLWLEQKYRSPYTGEIIPLGKLFTPAYEIEHIIPQSVYFDDSYNNKVICEAAVNKEKGNLLGLPFIKEKHGMLIPLGGGKTVRVFGVQEYEQFVNEHYGSREAVTKKRNLLSEDIPEAFINRQLNDTRYISKFVKTLLSNIVRNDDEQDGISRNVITCTGGVTKRLKTDWGIKDIWSQLLLPRFKRMEALLIGETFVTINRNGKQVPCIPDIYRRGYSIKRLDHRHHAMDAIVIACATRNIVNYLNNESARKGAKISRVDLQRMLCDKTHLDDVGNYKWVVRKPKDDFVHLVHEALSSVIISYKQNIRVINKTANKYHRFVDGQKVLALQTKGDSWSIRKPMHKETYFGEINLRKTKFVTISEALKQPERIVRKDVKLFVKGLKNCSTSVIKNKLAEMFSGVSRLEIYYFTNETSSHYYATRKSLDESFSKRRIEESVADSGIRKILRKHLALNSDDPKIAFSPEGIEAMNKDIVSLNDGKFHQPIIKVRCYEEASKFCVGETGNKTKKFVEAAKGTNLFFAVYSNDSGKRSFDSIPLNIAIIREKNGESPVPQVNDLGQSLLFSLSPNDLVYLPTADEIERGKIDHPIANDRIYKMVSCTGRNCFFIPANVSKCIVDKVEFSPLNKMERAVTGEMIKDICVPIKVNRIGTVIQISPNTL